eukprot:Skav212786  [mRNA]  locus=scaffold159:364878:367318:- [translate_table: standard]
MACAFGKLGHGNRLAQSTPKVVVALQGKRVIQVALGPHHSAALTQKGEVYTWGQAVAWGANTGAFGYKDLGPKAGRLGHASQGAEVDDAWRTAAGDPGRVHKHQKEKPRDSTGAPWIAPGASPHGRSSGDAAAPRGGAEPRLRGADFLRPQPLLRGHRLGRRLGLGIFQEWSSGGTLVQEAG